jgi:hypothetical protein
MLSHKAAPTVILGQLTVVLLQVYVHLLLKLNDNNFNDHFKRLPLYLIECYFKVFL